MRGDGGHNFGFLSYSKKRAGKGMWVLTTTPLSFLPITLPVGSSWDIAEVTVTLRESSRGSDVLV